MAKKKLPKQACAIIRDSYNYVQGDLASLALEKPELRWARRLEKGLGKIIQKYC